MASRQSATRNARKHANHFFVFFLAQRLSRSGSRVAKPQQPAGLMLRVEAVRPPRLERHQFDIPRLRLIDRRDTSARQRMQRVERVLRRMAGAERRMAFSAWKPPL